MMYRLNSDENLIRSSSFANETLRGSSGQNVVFIQEVVVPKSRSQERLVEQRRETVNIVEFLGHTSLNSLLQYVIWLVWEVCSVN